MAETKRMTAERGRQLAAGEEHADFLRESLRWCRAAADGGRGRRSWSAPAGTSAAAERSTHRNGYRERGWADAGGRDRAGDPEARPRQLLPELPRAAPALRAGAGGGRAGGVRRTASRRARSTRWSSQLGLRHREERGRRGSAPASTSRSTRSASGRWRAATRTCGWTPRSRRSATAAASRRKALVVAYGVHETGCREVIGLDVGEAETEAFWREFLRGLRRARPGRRAAGRLRRPRGPEERDRARCSAAPGSAAPCTSCARRSATSAETSSHARRADPADLQRRGPYR